MLAEYQQAIEKYRQRVFSFAYYSLRIREDAEDITQDVFIRLWQHWLKVDHGRMGAWLMRVAHNSVVDHVRKHRNEKQRVDLQHSLEDALTVEDPGLEMQQFSQQLESAISELNDPYRSIIIMRDIQGMSYAEIEQTLDLSQSQVKVYLHRGRRQLRSNQSLRNAAIEQTIIREEPSEVKQDSVLAIHRNHEEGTGHVK